MRILDIHGNELHDPDLTAGYLTDETIVVAHHDAEPETPEVIESVEVEDGLFEKRVVQEWRPAHSAWDETEQIQRYTAYTAEEILRMAAEVAERERAEREAVEQAERERAFREKLEALPQQLEDVMLAVAELGVLIGGE